MTITNTAANEVNLQTRLQDNNIIDTETLHDFGRKHKNQNIDFTQWKPPTLPAHLQEVEQDNPELIEYIREYWIIPPYTEGVDIPNLSETGPNGDYSQEGQPSLVYKLLQNRTKGFLIECGAADGFKVSNSLFLELHRKWSGILIEANPIYFESLLMKQHSMYHINACLSPTTRSVMFNFSSSNLLGGITDFIPNQRKESFNIEDSKATAVQCFPLYSILAALGRRHVDYFSLDIEGAEIKVLQTIPFDMLTFDVFTVETRNYKDEAATAEKNKLVGQILTNAGYHLVRNLYSDVVFMRNETVNDVV